MPSVKGKRGLNSHHYRPASDYDDATLAQKREYWRNKKREQRARLSEQRRKPPEASKERKFPTRVSARANTSLSDSFAVFSSPLPSYSDSGQRLTSTKVNKVLHNLQPAPCSISARTAAVKCPTGLVTAVKCSGIQEESSSFLVPPITTKSSSGSCMKREPQPCESMQCSTLPETSFKEEAELGELRLMETSVDAEKGIQTSVGPVRVKTEQEEKNVTSECGTKRAFSAQRAKGVGGASPALESEEEKAAKRREQWRIKKREQRAKLAARLARVRERTQPRDVSHQPAQRAAVKAVQVRAPFTSVAQDAGRLLSGTAAVLLTNLQADQMAVHSPPGGRMPPAAFTTLHHNLSAETLRKMSSVHHSSVTRGIARCKTPRQKFNEVQKNLVSLRSLRCKPPLMVKVLPTRGILRIDANDTPEQLIAKRREYWRIKKREQRAKLSVDKKARLKEKDSLIRRVKRYQQILEDMRRARTLAQSGPGPASEAIGGFIKEDGTLTVNVPQTAKRQCSAGERYKKELIGLCKNAITHVQHRYDAKVRDAAPVTLNQRLALSGPSPVKAALPLTVQAMKRSQKELPVKPHNEISIIPSSPSLPTQKAQQQLTLTLPQSQQSPTAVGSRHGACVMKMAVSSQVPSLSLMSQDPTLSEEERMAKRREYWRVKKREQRAARAVRMKHSVLGGTALLRRKLPTREPANSRSLSRSVTGAEKTGSYDCLDVPTLTEGIKQETECPPEGEDLPEQAECPDLKPPVSPAASAGLQPDQSLSADQQAATLLAVASMRKLLEESLCTVADSREETAGIKMEISEDASSQEVKPDLFSHHAAENDVSSPVAADPLSEDDSSVVSHLNQSSHSHVAFSPPVSPSEEVQHSPPEPSESIPLLRPFPDPPAPHHTTGPDQQQLRRCQSSKPLSPLQKKREYWKLMKRQQRARLRARQGKPQGDQHSAVSPQNTQAHAGKNIQRGSPVAAAVQAECSGLPGLLAGTSSSEPCADTLQVPEPVSPSPGREHGVKLEAESTESDSASPLPALNPPNNPLLDTPLLPIGFPDQSLSTSLIPVEVPSAQLQDPFVMVQSSAMLAHASTLVPPKPVPGESEEDFLKRKREYWRVKKKEQRARKAGRDKRLTVTRVCNGQMPLEPVQHIEPLQSGGEDFSQWVSSSEVSEQLLSPPEDADPEGPCVFPSYPVHVEEEFQFADYGAAGEEGPLSEAAWRNRYLMDYDPLNQLLVCMVCGEPQYSHGPDGVKAHIEEAHPHTLSLETAEKQRILEAWDEQVSQREHFFSSQLQQHSGAPADT